MSRDSSFDNNPMEDSQDSEETMEQFDEVRQYFSEEECAKLGRLGQKICVYMKKNYEYLIGQVLELLGSREDETNPWLGRLRERKNDIVYEEISDPEEDD
ncbi:unnamed protein product [Pipistrellus nathusii]|uniref:Uncharacterized protein n=1 Tax=Pipistrellus nathusii TaxID=59473 RepID=A0ABP0AHE8_PIPNA